MQPRLLYHLRYRAKQVNGVETSISIALIQMRDSTEWKTYANAILQSLYHCQPFRDCVNTYPSLTTPYIPSSSATSLSYPSIITPSPEPLGRSAASIPPLQSSPVTVNVSSSSANKSRWSATLSKRNITPTDPPALASPTSLHVDPLSMSQAGHLSQPRTNVPPPSLFVALQSLFRQIATMPIEYGSSAADLSTSISTTGSTGQAAGNLLGVAGNGNGTTGSGPGDMGTGVVAPATFMGKLKMENEMFRGTMQQVSLESLSG
ncbi:Peptidase C19, ubiquitin carboxyl-terminal hydrolase [Phaffia rhodozyma]|uniref:Peptidase C19, ubiquitin carboxyl-terminal hydrolase n=1 Tax=Phaffia rhodozyma TaxID=264483 RepID=A0A0F7SHT5_PHARH|nr:Peptidase C19, ubiquitin carboxyl-terminal hydrolase [Phaffia rhodozyma]